MGVERLDPEPKVLVRRPYAGTTVGEFPHAGLDLVEKAITAAHKGYRVMRELANYERADLLLRIADLIRRDLGEYTQIVCSETGKPIKEAKVEVERSLQTQVAAAHQARHL